MSDVQPSVFRDSRDHHDQRDRIDQARDTVKSTADTAADWAHQQEYHAEVAKENIDTSIYNKEVQARGTIENVKEKVRGVVEGARDRVEQLEDKIAQETHAAKETVDESLHHAKDAIRGSYENAKDTVKDKVGSAKENVKESYDSAKENVKESYDSAKERGEEIRENAHEKADELYNRAREEKESWHQHHHEDSWLDHIPSPGIGSTPPFVHTTMYPHEALLKTTITVTETTTIIEPLHDSSYVTAPSTTTEGIVLDKYHAAEAGARLANAVEQMSEL